jgi:RNA polymerase subunit RPABC4/transcription elongation factor Spt4
MSSNYARGHRARGACDRCGNNYLLNTLVQESVQGRLKGNRVCPDCYDPDHPQNWQGTVPLRDPQALRFARTVPPEQPVPVYPPASPPPYFIGNGNTEPMGP